jgi:tRNA dimethylallyltransferase|nr:tRNA (adenosine(37)-N6)-dimethylallyltransferase MiaA [uncultured Capnocytophaga sp.]
MNFLINIIGPTAIGKTALAITLAKHFKTEIISCDSRQFYKEMTIGTAVPTEEELAQVPHHFIQHLSIFEDYSVGKFEREAIDFLSSFLKNKNIIIMVGGSGLYNDAILRGLDDFPEVSPQLREELNKLYKSEGITPLQEKLKEIDPSYYDKVDLQNPQRIIRALEVSLSTNIPYSSFLDKKSTIRDFISISIGLNAPREIIYDRINNRLEIMLYQGLLQEIENLFPYRDLNALQTVGYREFFEFWEKKTSLCEAIEKAKMNTRRFAKRQLTWFNKDKSIHWFDFLEKPEKIISFIESKLLEYKTKEQ